MNNSIGGLKENIVSFVVLICSLISGIGIIVALGTLIFEPNNIFVRDYAKQSLLFSIVFSLLTILSAITYLFTLLNLVLSIIVVITAYHAYKKEVFKFKFIEKIMNKINL